MQSKATGNLFYRLPLVEDEMKVFFKKIDSIIEKALKIFNCILAASIVIVIFLETFSR